MAAKNSHNHLCKKDIHSCDRLMRAAEKLFADKGFNATSIRDITKLADCNVAAVNYHFGSKENIYLEVFRRHLQLLSEIRIKGIQQIMSRPEQVSLETILDAFARLFYEPLVDEQAGGMFMKLMMREMLDPHLSPELFITEMIGPVRKALGQALRQVCPELDEKTLGLCIFSLIGQLIHTIHMQKMTNAFKGADLPFADRKVLFEHIVRFTAAGIRSMEKKNSK